MREGAARTFKTLRPCPTVWHAGPQVGPVGAMLERAAAFHTRQCCIIGVRNLWFKLSADNHDSATPPRYRDVNLKR